MANKSAHKARMRAHIVEQASQALRSSGLNGISVADLMKRAGLTHGGFYAYFSSRDDLVAAAIAHMFEGTGRMLEAYLGERPDEPGLSALIDFYLSQPNLQRVEQGCPLPALSGEISRMPGPARVTFEAGIRLFRDRIARALAASGRPDSDRLAQSILSEMVGALTLGRAMGDDAAALGFIEAARDDLKQRLHLH